MKKLSFSSSMRIVGRFRSEKMQEILGLEADLLRETDSSAALLQLDAGQARRLGTTGSSTLLQLDAGEARKRGRLSSTLLQPDAREEGKRGRLGTKGSSSPLQPDARKKRR